LSKTSVDVSHERSHSEIMIILYALMLAMLLAALDQTIVSTALPKIVQDLHGLNKLSWVATSYLLTSAIVTPLYGKISDQIGRKKVFIFAIILFLFGSALCGFSQNMDQLVIFRGIQGLGGGGLISLALAVIGDIVPPRQRGKYQGYFGGVFAISSVLGPLLGGLFTEHISWRWIFYINLPLGLIALSAISARLHLPPNKIKHKIDYFGSILMSISLACLLLALTWGGNTYAWGSNQIMSLFAGFTVFTAGLIFWETKASEPFFPLDLFKRPIFVVSSALSAVAGLTLLGTVIFLPAYQQIVRGESPISSGLHLLPLVIGIFSMVITGGRLITKTGRYKIFPIIGTLIAGVGLWLLSHVTAHTSTLALSSWMFVTGVGIGLFLQVMVLAVQNSVERERLGTATGLVTFFRSIGSSIGTAVFGAFLINRLSVHISEVLPKADKGLSKAIAGSGLSGSTANLPIAIKDQIFVAFSRSFHDLFLFALPFVLLGFLLALILEEVPLRNSVGEKPIAE